MPLTPESGIQYLKGVGEKRAALYAKLGVHTVRDLLRHFPRDYIDLSAPCEVASAPVGETCAIRAVLLSKSKEQRIRAGLSVFKLEAADGSGSFAITIFNSKYTVDALQPGQEYIFYGRLTGSLLRREMLSPSIYPLPGAERILPVYPQTAGIHSGLIRRNILQALREVEIPEDPLPRDILRKHGLPPAEEAVRNIHFPGDLAAAERARARFIFEELLTLSCALSTLRADHTAEAVQAMRRIDLGPFYASLPFSPTGAQLRCIGEAVEDLCSALPMNRLIQGDVGSGKTLVAAACLYFAQQNGVQSAVMAPTEILAEQHLTTMTAFLDPLGVRAALLTGSTRAVARRALCARLAAGEIDVLIGTHALLSEGVQFRRLGLVVTDEQHRFGVAQRAKLSQKSEGVHVLVMSATPIPRTLSLIIYGDLKLSVLDELPPGRQPVETLVIDSGKRERAMGFVRKHLEEGRQAYIVCPLVERGEEDTGLRPAVEYAQKLSEADLRGFRVGLLHGRIKPKEKEDAMRRFKSGEIQALVSTTVVEVGVDVPNAVIILIENAERFGLSQLHQLRGRVGRGSEKSWCILVSDTKGEAARERLSVMKRSSDGFEIAEQDLRQRGPGDFFGYRQHGLPALKVADLAADLTVLQSAQDCAQELLARDPSLSLPEHRALRASVAEMLRAVGERPN